MSTLTTPAIGPYLEKVRKPDGGLVPKWYMEILYKKDCLKAGVGPYRLHDLRHTFNTNMTKAGVDQVVIMKLTGYRTNKMFLRYSHLDKESHGRKGRLTIDFKETKVRKTVNTGGTL